MCVSTNQLSAYGTFLGRCLISRKFIQNSALISLYTQIQICSSSCLLPSQKMESLFLTFCRLRLHMLANPINSISRRCQFLTTSMVNTPVRSTIVFCLDYFDCLLPVLPASTSALLRFILQQDAAHPFLMYVTQMMVLLPSVLSHLNQNTSQWPVGLSTAVTSLTSSLLPSSLTPASLPFLKYSARSYLRPLYLLLPLPRILFPRYTQLSPSPPSRLLQNVTLSGGLS